jgi:phosphate transport system protein
MQTNEKSANPVQREALINYVISLARTVESAVEKAVDSLLRHDQRLASEVFLMEPRMNEMEVLIDDFGVRLLSQGVTEPVDIRLIVASMKIANDLERIGDLAVNICERVVSLREDAALPADLAPMANSVLVMLRQSLGALSHRNADLAIRVLESDDLVDRYRDQVFQALLQGMAEAPVTIAPNLQFVLVSRFLERIADHSTNIAEDVIFWVRGLDVRHGRGSQLAAAAST